MSTMENDAPRREVKSRNTRWAHGAAGVLRGMGVRPNQISVAGIFFAAAGAAAFYFLGQPHGRTAGILLALGAVAGIQGRLLCNLFDGMVAIEGGLRSRSGELFNDFPDRISDTLLLVGAGYAAGGEHGVALGYIAALCAMLTAYARVLGGAAGARQYFTGPMAKQHRMAVLTVAALAVIFVDPLPEGRYGAMSVALALIIGGSVVTTVRRLFQVYRELEGAA